jgi:hypothetical protein
MKVILDIPEESLKKLGEMAKMQKRSRKAFMEFILISKSDTPNYDNNLKDSDKWTRAPEEFMIDKEINIKPKEEDVPNWKKAYNEYLKTQKNKK